MQFLQKLTASFPPSYNVQLLQNLDIFSPPYEFLQYRNFIIRIYMDIYWHLTKLIESF